MLPSQCSNVFHGQDGVISTGPRNAVCVIKGLVYATWLNFFWENIRYFYYIRKIENHVQIHFLWLKANKSSFQWRSFSTENAKIFSLFKSSLWNHLILPYMSILLFLMWQRIFVTYCNIFLYLENTFGQWVVVLLWWFWQIDVLYFVALRFMAKFEFLLRFLKWDKN